MKSKRRIVSLVLALLLTAIGIYGVMIGANAEEATVSEPIKFVDANGAVDESVLFAVYDADGNLVKTYTSESDFVTACDSLNTKNTRGTVELYSDVTSGKIFTGETGSATNVYVTIKLNGYTLTPSADWIKLAKNQGYKHVTIEGPGQFGNENATKKVFYMATANSQSEITFKNVDIKVLHTLVYGSSGQYRFENCDISWSESLGSTNGLITNFGGNYNRERNGTITFVDSRIKSTGTGTSSASKGFIVKTMPSGASKDVTGNYVTSIITFDGCEIDHNGYILTAHANFDSADKDYYSPNIDQPTPTLNIIDTKTQNVKCLASAQYGNKVTVNVSGNSVLDVYRDTLVHTGNDAGKYKSEVILNLAEGVRFDELYNSGYNVELNADGKIVKLVDSDNYIVLKTPSVKANVTLNSDFNFNFYVPKENFVSASVNGAPVSDIGSIDIGGVEYVGVSYDGIAPAEAGQVKTVAIKMTNGKYTYIANYSVSIPKYITNVVDYANAGYTDSVRALSLMASIVNYIDASYAKFGTTEGRDSINELKTLLADDIANLEKYAMVAPMDTMSALSEYVASTAMIIDSTPKFVVNLESTFTGTISINGTEYRVENGKVDGKTYVAYNFRARNVSDAIAVKVGDKVGKFNIRAYYDYLNGLGDTASCNLLDALYVYGKEAAKYKAHDYDESQIYRDKDYHWHICNDTRCNSIVGKAAHSFDDEGVCRSCEYVYGSDEEIGNFLNSLGMGESVRTDRDDVVFAKVLDKASATYAFTSEEKEQVKNGDMLLFSFVAKADGKSAPMNFNIDVGTAINGQDNSTVMTYYIPTQWTRIYMPVKNNGMNRVTIETSGRVMIAEAKYENRIDATQSDLQRESGMWMLEDFDEVDISSYGLGVGASIDLVKHGNYVYSIGGGALSVTDVASETVVGKLTGFGTLRQIDITDDGKHVVISGRQDGVYIVNVEDPAAPKFVSAYNSIEMATGLHVSGNYAFVCNRQYGVEVVDISDPKNPTHLINIHSGEVQSCVVYGNYLYAGVWGECGVYIYNLDDITDSSFIEPLGVITTNGKGDGLSVTEMNGRVYLFAATGQHTYSASTKSPLDNLCYGQGNGMDIYDVTDPKNAKWMSTAKIDGRYYYTGNDYWETEVGYDAENDRYYAYLVNTYNGVYVFDVTDVEAPTRLAHLVVSLPLGDKVPALSHSSRAIITPWDQTKEHRSPVGAIIVEDGVIYVAGSDTNADLYKYNSSLIFGHKAESLKETGFGNLSENYYAFDNTLSGGSLSSLASGSYSFSESGDGQYLAIVTNGDYVYVAAGAAGVKIFEKSNLTLVGTIPAPRVTVSGSVGERVGFAEDVKVYDNQLYVAFDIAGLRVYDISGDKAENPTHSWTYASSSTNIFRQVTVSPEGKFSVVQVDNNAVWLINNTTHKRVKTYKTAGGHMYHHNLTPLIDDRYVGFWSHENYEYWLDFGPEGERYDEPIFCYTGTSEQGYFTGSLGMWNGANEITVNGETYVIKLQGGQDNASAVYTDKYNAKGGTAIKGVNVNGKPTVCGNYLFVAERIFGEIYVYDISYLTDENSNKTSAVLLGTIKVDGNPDLIFTDGTAVYIPLGYQGMLVIDTTKAFSENAEN